MQRHLNRRLYAAIKIAKGVTANFGTNIRNPFSHSTKSLYPTFSLETAVCWRSLDSCVALILQGLLDPSDRMRGWCGSSRWKAGCAFGSLTKFSSETAVCFCSQSSIVNLSKAAVSLLLTPAHALRSSVADKGSASTLSAFVNVAQSRTPHRHHQDGRRNQSRGRGLCGGKDHWP